MFFHKYNITEWLMHSVTDGGIKSEYNTEDGQDGSFLARNLSNGRIIVLSFIMLVLSRVN